MSPGEIDYIATQHIGKRISFIYLPSVWNIHQPAHLPVLSNRKNPPLNRKSSPPVFEWCTYAIGRVEESTQEKEI